MPDRRTRRAVLAGLAATGAAVGVAAGTAAAAQSLLAPAAVTRTPEPRPSLLGIGYLEDLAAPGRLAPDMAYLAPSALDARYSHAIYVNTAWSGPGMQKMWVIGRDGRGWSLALHDEGHWGGNRPDYSWPVSTGKWWPGDNRAGPTPTGIFNVDERLARHRTGWGSPGMYKAVYIDLHYGSGRISGVAMHGTTWGQYRRLGRPASHGCVRMTQANADLVWEMIHHPAGARRGASARWGEVPRYFASDPADSLAARRNYVRDGSLLRGADGRVLTKEGYRVLFVFFRDDL